MVNHARQDGTHLGWRDDNARVQAARQPFARRAQRLFQVGGMAGFCGLPSARRQAADVDTQGYYTYPLLFYTAFPEVSLAQLRTLSLAGSYLFDQILCQDSIIDDSHGANPATLLLAGMLQQEALALLYTLFPADSPFWRYFAGYQEHFTQAVLRECICHRFLLTPYSDEERLFIYGGKPALGKACMAALALLGDRPAAIPAFAASHDHFHVAYQLMDDLEDWRLDYRRGHYSYPLTWAFLQAGWQSKIESGPRPHPDQVARLLEETGTVAHVQEVALASLEQAERVLETGMADGSWRAAIQQTRRAVQQLRLREVPPPAPGPLGDPAARAWQAAVARATTATPIGASWLGWLDGSRTPHVPVAGIRAIQRKILGRLGGASTLGEALAQVGLAIAGSYARYPAHDLADHLGLTSAELAWCRRNRRWLDAMLALSLEEPPCLWTPATPAPRPAGWAPAGLGRFLGHALVQELMDDGVAPDQASPAQVLDHFRRQLIG